MVKNLSVVDLFCGVGGLTHGFILENIKVIAGIDNDLTCKYAYEKNNGALFIHKSIKDVKGKDITKLYEKRDLKILVGCAPCQPFSLYSKKKLKDSRWNLLQEFSRLINEINPEIVSMENVPRLKKCKIFQEFIENLERGGYFVSWKIIFCQDYGIPQSRRRLVLLASKLGKIRLISKTWDKKKGPTIKNFIKNLEPIKAGEISKKDPLHRARNLSELNKKRIKSTPEGGGWKDWNSKLILNCHKKASGKSYGSVYGRMKWEAVGPTITTQFQIYGCGRHGHPQQNRALSLREGSLIQTFPKKYDFIDPSSKFSSRDIARHIGNAVPIKLAEIIAKSIKEHVANLSYGTD